MERWSSLPLGGIREFQEAGMKIQAHTTKTNDARQANGGCFGIVMEH